ncbi:MAG TPA: zf-HC2 domain-containing protein [Verrucomicrobiae bacterium]|nr:zf-HC2 domain-containing protein [Verrucomicrobiae bacterium]
MNCDEALRRLSVDLDGELNPLESTALRRHTSACPDCARRRRLLDQTRAAFRAGDRRSGAWPLVSTALLVAILGWSFLALRREAGVPGPPVSSAARQAALKRTVPLSLSQLKNAMAGVDCGKPGAVHCVIEQPCLDCGLRQPGLDLR